MTALKRSQRASAESGGASARERRRCRPSVVLAHALASHTAHVLNSEPRPVPCLWLRPCNGVRLPGGSAGDRTHWDLSARVCQPLGPSRSRTLFLLLTCVVCMSSQIKCAGWRSSLLANEGSFGIYSSILTHTSSGARCADGAVGRDCAQETFSARVG